MSVDSIYRHIRSHLAQDVRAALRGSQGLSTSDMIQRLADVANDALHARRAALEAGHTQNSLRAGDAELRALTVLLGRFGIDDLELIDQLKAGETLARAVGQATTRNPAIGTEVATRLRLLGDSQTADALERHAAVAAGSNPEMKEVTE
ncbi:hypothetical protein E3T23_01805 [Cryobacterium cheniae]|uniref:Uncharacterized protein n=1 Tax=Cryobacterium cheniae TaxID=1259262 RepID=A0A4R8XXC7_9MICO|nr:hypothetical protein [Cryobacterium cheniae]TFC83720.1 hypothetical protein E3T23_01805 [Cryobacterium cheniae]